jgi:hypothetical protein
VNDLWNKRLKAAIAIIALLGLAGCGGGSGGGSATPDNAATISGSATVNTNTLVMGVAQTAQIASTTANADGSTQLVTTPNSTFGAALTVGSVVQASGGTDARFPLGLVGKVTSVTTGSDGVTTAVLTNATLADVVQKSSFQANEVALDSTNFIGVISPKAVQASTTIPQPTLSVLQQGITALNGGLVLSEPNSLGRIANKAQSGLSFLGGNGTVDAGKINLNLGVKLADMGLDSTRLKPYGKSGEAGFDIFGSITNLKLIENHDFDTTAGVNTGLKSMDLRVTGDIAVDVNLHGGVEADLGYYSRAWKDVAEEEVKLLGVSGKLTGLNSTDKAGKYPIAGLVFSVPCPPPGCPVLAGQTKIPLQAAKAGGIIVWVYLTASGKIVLDGKVGAKLNPGKLNLGLQKSEGKQLDVIHELSNEGKDRLIEAPYFDGAVNSTLRLGSELDVDFFILGVRAGNVSMFVGGQANATLKTVTALGYGTTGLGQPWTWDGQACLQSHIGAGLIISAAANLGVDVDTWMGKIDGKLTYGGVWPTEDEILIPGLHGIGNLTWLTKGESSNCFPAPVASKIITVQDASHLATITVSGEKLPDDLLLDITPAANCTGLKQTVASDTSVSFTCQMGVAATGLVYKLSSVKAENIDLSEVANHLNYTATPTYSAISCGTPAAGQLMTCTVTGANLPLDLALSATGCANIQPVGDTASTTQRQFTCTPASQGALQVSVSSVNVGSGATYAQNITIGQAACTLPQVLTNGVCAVPVATTCTLPQVLTNGACVTPTPAATGKLNDTGITASQCYQAGSNTLVACNSAGALALSNAQDGMTGRDANPAGNSGTDGKLGFSFAAVAGGCVQDNITGLMWEVKTADGGLRDWNKTYTNYDSTASAQKLNGSTYVNPTQADIDAATNSTGFKNSVNATNLCGHNDWRLPTADELQSIVDYGVASPAIDATWFPNTKGNWFWSASPDVGGSGYAWGVDFNNGYVNGYVSRDSTGYVRLVRAGQ